MPLIIALFVLITGLTVRADLVTSFTIVGDDEGWITVDPIIVTPDEYTFSGGLSLDSVQFTIEAYRDLGGPNSDLVSLYMYSRDEEIAPGKTFTWEPEDALSGAGWMILTGKPAGATQIRSTGDGGGTVTIHEMELNPDNSFKRLAIDFSTTFAHWNYFGPPRVDTGSIRIASSYPVTIVPEPASASLLVMSLLLLRPFMARRRV